MNFLKNSKAIAVIFVLTSNILLAQNKTEFPLNLLFSKKDVPRILENTKLPIFKDYWKSLLEADFEQDGNFLREAFVYALTGNSQKGENAKQGMLTTLKRKRWDMFLEDGKETIGFLTAGRLTAWMSLSYDWIYDLLSPAEREEILKQIAEQGCVPCYRALYGMRYPETVKGWGFDPEQTNHYEVPDMSRWPVILGHNNFRAVISGGFALGLFALEGRDNRFDKWFDMLMDSYYRSAKLYGADGSYDEGMSYCNYANTYLVYFIEVMKRKRNIDLFDAINFMGMMDCNLALFYPHHLDPAGSVNFGDSGPSMNSSNSFWIARKSRDGLAQYQALNYAKKHDLFSLVYYDPSVKPDAPKNGLILNQLEFDWIVTRTGYDMNDLVVGMRSGPPSNHEHADRNSVVLKYFGEILLTDSKRPTYDPNSPGWLLRTSPAHNTILIDGKGHQYHKGEEGTNASQASAKIIRRGQRPGYVFWTSDATPAYSIVDNDVKSVMRTVLVFGKIPFILVLDKIEKKIVTSNFSARWFVENSDKNGKIEANAQTFTITRPDAKLFGFCAGNQDLELKTSKLPLDESIGVFPYVDVNTVNKSKEAFIILAGSPLQISEKNPKIEIKEENNKWTIEVFKGSKYLRLNVFDQDLVPEFEIVELKIE